MCEPTTTTDDELPIINDVRLALGRTGMACFSSSNSNRQSTIVNRQVRGPLGWMIVAWATLCPSVLGAGPGATAATAKAIGEHVLHTLLSTPLGKTVPPAAYEVTILQKKAVNAWSNPTGKLQIDTGILPVLGDEPGAWAAVISHEIGHFVILKAHENYLLAFRSEVEKSYRQTAAGQHDTGAGETLLSAPLGRGLANLPLSQEKEYEADRVGLLLMAEAGYHPDFAVAVHNRMGWLLHNSGWRAREAHLMKAYDVALAIFQSRWPDPAQSPGGSPPPIGDFGIITTTPDGKDRSVIFHATVHVRNAAGLEVRVAAIFQVGNALLKAALPEFRSPGGELEVNATLPGASQMSTQVALRLPAAAVAGTHRSFRAVLYLTVGEERLDISQFIHVELPE
jgi:Peptidase family M48